MIVFDTDVFSLFQRASDREHEQILKRLSELPEKDFSLTVVTLEEETRGWLAEIGRCKTMESLIYGYQRLQGILADLQAWPVLSFDEAAAECWQRHRANGVRIGTLDLRIASIVMANNAVLLTRNKRDFLKVPGLHLRVW